MFTKSARAKDTRGVDLISDALPFGGLWYGEPDAISTFSRLRKVLQPARIASLSSLISWAMSSRLASLPLLGKERLLFLLGTNHFLD